MSISEIPFCLSILGSQNPSTLEVLCTSRELNEIFKFFGNDLKQIFSRRLIESLYFDTLDFSLYKEKELYDVDTKTVRFRKYNNEDILYKEIKFNSTFNFGNFFFICFLIFKKDS